MFFRAYKHLNPADQLASFRCSDTLPLPQGQKRLIVVFNELLKQLANSWQ